MDARDPRTDYRGGCGVFNAERSGERAALRRANVWGHFVTRRCPKKNYASSMSGPGRFIFEGFKVERTGLIPWFYGGHADCFEQLGLYGSSGNASIRFPADRSINN